MADAWAVLTAAGSGTRLGAETPKALVTVAGASLLQLSLVRLVETPGIQGVVITCPTGQEDVFEAAVGGITGQLGTGRFAASKHPRTRVLVVAGGSSRQASVKNGLDALRDFAPSLGKPLTPKTPILVHDAARALAPQTLMTELLDVIRGGAAAVIPGLPVVDTIKEVSTGPGGDMEVVRTPPRASLRSVQTPQAFAWGKLLEVHKAASKRGESEATAATDDATLMEESGIPVLVIEGSDQAFKVTNPEDLFRLEMLLNDLSAVQ